MKPTRKISLLVSVLALWVTNPVKAQVEIDGFVQGLFGGRLDRDPRVATEFTASETRFQLRAQHFGDKAEMFGRLDFLYDAVDTAEYAWELREAFIKFRLGDNFDFKIGRQILTWGTGDLLFINDVFAKDYVSFFIGRDDQYLKAPQNALRVEYFNLLGNLSLVWSPRFEGNRLPRGERLSFYNTLDQAIVGSESYADPVRPALRFKNGELAMRFSRPIGRFSAAVYYYHGFYKNPVGLAISNGTSFAFYPGLNLYGASLRGSFGGGILWLESGYFDANSNFHANQLAYPVGQWLGLLGFERQIATNLTANIQWEVDVLSDIDAFLSGLGPFEYKRRKVRHLLTSRVTKLLSNELLTISLFAFYSPSDDDFYLRLNTKYNYSDELTLSAGGNYFTGVHASTEFGQLSFNDNVYIKITYGF